MSELVHLRLEEKLLQKMDQVVEHGYFSNRTELVRDAVRRLVIEFDKFNALIQLKSQRGSLKGEYITEKAKAEALRKLVKEKGWKIEL